MYGDINLIELFKSHAAQNKQPLDLFIQATDLLPLNLDMDDMNVGWEGNNSDMDVGVDRREITVIFLILVI